MSGWAAKSLFRNINGAIKARAGLTNLANAVQAGDAGTQTLKNLEGDFVTSTATWDTDRFSALVKNGASNVGDIPFQNTDSNYTVSTTAAGYVGFEIEDAFAEDGSTTKFQADISNHEFDNDTAGVGDETITIALTNKKPFNKLILDFNSTQKWVDYTIRGRITGGSFVELLAVIANNSSAPTHVWVNGISYDDYEIQVTKTQSSQFMVHEIGFIEAAQGTADVTTDIAIAGTAGDLDPSTLEVKNELGQSQTVLNVQYSTDDGSNYSTYQTHAQFIANDPINYTDGFKLRVQFSGDITVASVAISTLQSMFDMNANAIRLLSQSIVKWSADNTGVQVIADAAEPSPTPNAMTIYSDGQELKTKNALGNVQPLNPFEVVGNEIKAKSAYKLNTDTIVGDTGTNFNPNTQGDFVTSNAHWDTDHFDTLDPDGANNTSTTDHTPVMTSNTVDVSSSLFATVSSSGTYNGSSSEYSCFDSNESGTYFQTANVFSTDGTGSTSETDSTTKTGTAWLRIKYETAVVINKYDLYTSTGGVPVDWIIEGSNDNSAWTLLDTVVGNTTAESTRSSAYDFVNSVAYQYYRMTTTRTKTDPYWGLFDLRFIESAQAEVDITTNLVTGAAGVIQPNTIVVRDKDDGILLDANYDVSYKIDSNSYTSVMDADVFKALNNLSFTDSFDLRITFSGANTVKELSISSSQTVTKITQLGLEVITDGVQELLLNKDELKVSSQIYTPEVSLVPATNVSINAAMSNSFSMLMDQNVILDNPTNLKAGAKYLIRIVQDATGSRLLTFGTSFKFAGGTAPTLSTGANAIDVLEFYSDGTDLYLTKQSLNFS